MTKEEELDWLCRLRSEIYVYMPKEWLIPMNNALDMAISALSTEGDLISRQAVLYELKKWDWQDLYLPIHFKQILDDVPSADVRPNIHGHWIKINSGDEDFTESIVCDRCNHENSHLDFNEHNEPIGKVFVTSNFCPNCGADMRGE